MGTVKTNEIGTGVTDNGNSAGGNNALILSLGGLCVGGAVIENWVDPEGGVALIASVLSLSTAVGVIVVCAASFLSFLKQKLG